MTRTGKARKIRRTTMTYPENFVAVIMSHGRPEFTHNHTYKSLRDHGYTGPVIVLVDNEDKTLDGYRSLFGDDNVVVFDKDEWARKTDECDNFRHRKAIVYARNASFDVVRARGYRYFIQLDDDYNSWRYKRRSDGKFISKKIKSLDSVFSVMLDYYIASGATSIAFAQDGDFMGGRLADIALKWYAKRKCMNTWICDIEKPIVYSGHMNEDCSAYVVHGLRGGLFLQIPFVSINQVQTQAAAGGMTDLYKSAGTYNKTFYTVMQAPSCCVVHEIGYENRRIHHKIIWPNAAPKILRESVRE